MFTGTLTVSLAPLNRTLATIPQQMSLRTALRRLATVVALF